MAPAEMHCVRQTMRVMSCSASMIVTTEKGEHAAGLLSAATQRLHELERRWSRFLPSSEVSLLNRSGGTAVRVSPDTVRLVEEMVRGWHATSGCFDPTLLAALVELGYAHSREDAGRRTSLAECAERRGRPDAILVDRADGIVVLPVGTTIDPGGIGKGLAADIVTSELVAARALGAMVEVGGDLCVAGIGPSAMSGWVIEVDPGVTTGITSVALAAGGVATSTSRLRTWTVDGRTRHHLVDPQTLDCSDSDSVSCTVIAGTAAWAEAFTKTAFAVSPAQAIDVFDRHGLAAAIVTTGGDRITSRTWEHFAQ